jgi:hypothetical protein
MRLKVQSNKVASFSQKINDELYGISYDLLHFSLETYENVLIERTEQFFDQFPISEQEKEVFYPYYFWWMVFCSRDTISNNKTIYQMFLKRNQWKFRKKPLLKRTLSMWQYVIPSFFYIEEMASERVFCLYDIFDYTNYKVVVIPQDTFRQPTSNDVLSGIVLPLVDGGFFSVVDPLIIPDKIRLQLISKLIRIYQSDITITTGEFFSIHYPKMLKITIEHLIENKIKIQ